MYHCLNKKLSLFAHDDKYITSAGRAKIFEAAPHLYERFFVKIAQSLNGLLS
tara:strand:- start:831 stop:986 length:156 start_codon:yes stop_codon:yes gene_type:complete